MSETITAPNTESDILTRAIGLPRGPLPEELARAILSFQMAEVDQERVDQLCQRNNQGAITEEERDELGRYERVGTFLAILQSRARRSLKQADS